VPFSALKEGNPKREGTQRKKSKEKNDTGRSTSGMTIAKGALAKRGQRKRSGCAGGRVTVKDPLTRGVGKRSCRLLSRRGPSGIAGRKEREDGTE